MPEEGTVMQEVNQCEYAETALEHYMKENMRLKDENKELRENLKRLLWMMEEKD